MCLLTYCAEKACMDFLKQSATCEPNVTWLSAVFLSALAFSLGAKHFSDESRFSLTVGACLLSCTPWFKLSPWETDHAINNLSKLRTNTHSP